jgi:Ca2+-binding RTX toxin-like protein
VTTLIVGSGFPYSTISAAMTDASPGDTILLAAGYSDETATVSKEDITIEGDISSSGIVLHLSPGVTGVTLGGSAPIDVMDSGSSGLITVGNGNNYIAAGDGANTISAGSGNNFITASDAIDTISAMGGNNMIEAGGGANTVTTGLGNDVVETGNAADTVATGAGNDIIKDAGGAGTLTAGPGHDRIIMDISASTAPVTNTAVNVAGTYSGIIDATTYAGVEEFHITTGSGNDTIVTGDGADVLDGGAGADNLSAGGGSDVIYGGVGDVIDGGGNADGSDFDLLVLKDFGPYEIVLTDPNNSENGTVFQLDEPGGIRTGGEVKFTNIESIEFVDNTVTTPEDTVLNGDLGLSETTTVSTFLVGSTSYNAGDIVSRTEGNLQISADGTYIFTPAANYNGPGPVTTYTTVDATVPANAGTASLVIEVGPVDEEIPACLTGPIPPVPCFVEGAQIKTANGEVAVEDLKVGDLVQTLDHGLQELRWVGHRHLDAHELAEDDNLRPIRICKTVIGAENGVLDLVVSPQHRILIASKVAERMFDSTEVLVAAKHLLAIEGVDIAYDLEEVTYFHILFDHHEIVYAGGTPSESLYLGHQVQLSLTSDGWEEIMVLFPEVASPKFMPTSCRPIISGKQAKKLGLRHEKNSMPLLNRDLSITRCLGSRWSCVSKSCLCLRS